MNIETILSLFALFLTSILIWFFVAHKWQKLRKFFHISYTFVDILFIFLYFFEQLSLVVILARTTYSSQVVVGIFSIVVVTTASLQNRASESRINKISEIAIEQKTIIDSIIEGNEKLVKENRLLQEKLNKSKKFIQELFSELETLLDRFEKLRKRTLKK